MLAPWQGLAENVRHLLISQNILKLNYPTLNPVSDEMILDLNMLGHVMTHWVLSQLYKTLVVTKDKCLLQLKIKQSYNHLPKPHCFTTS